MKTAAQSDSPIERAMDLLVQRKAPQAGDAAVAKTEKSNSCAYRSLRSSLLFTLLAGSVLADSIRFFGFRNSRVASLRTHRKTALH